MEWLLKEIWAYFKYLEILMNIIDEKNPKLKEKYMIFANDYIERAT